MRRMLTIMGAVGLLAVAAALEGCSYFGTSHGQTVTVEGEPPPRLDLAGRAEVVRITRYSQCIPGPGATGRVGDYLIQNAFVRFVIAAPDTPDRSWMEVGGVLDAAIQGGEDHMNLLVPHLGDKFGPDVVTEEIRSQSPKLSGNPAEVTVLGHWRANSALVVRTTYLLSPSAKYLEITTNVENQTGAALQGVKLGDLLYHGRTERFVEGMGLHPAGRRRQTTMLSFFAGRRVWELHVPGTMPFLGDHQRNFSRVVYSEHGMQPAQVRTYHRRLTAAFGDPATVAERLLTAPQNRRATLDVRVIGEESEKPLRHAYVQVSAARTGAAALLLTDAEGKASARIASGDYEITCRAKGRGPFKCTIGVPDQTRHRLTVRLPAPARLRVKVLALEGGVQRPTAARLTVRRATVTTPLLHDGPHFSGLGPGRNVLVPPAGEIELSLPTAPRGLETAYFVLASRGPMFEVDGQRVRLEPGAMTELPLALRATGTPLTYASVDARQPVSGCPECTLTPKERAQLNDCEGLAGYMARHAGRYASGRAWPTGKGPIALPSLDVSTPQTGAASVLFAGADIRYRRVALPLPAQWGETAEEVFGLLRHNFPRSTIQIDDPLDERQGYFHITGIVPGSAASHPFSPHFDCLCILTGNDTKRAAKLLPLWFEMLNSGRKVFVTAGSNARTLRDGARMAARTYVHCPSKGKSPTVDELWRALDKLPTAQHAFVSNGPLLKVTAQTKPIGSLVAAKDGKVGLKVRVEAPLWITISTVTVFVNGKAAQVLKTEDRKDSILLDKSLDLEMKADGWIVVLVEGERGMAPLYCDDDGTGAVPFAVTNPIWVDANGDGTCTPLKAKR